MSAPNQGRQSPEPDTQTGAQQQDTPADAKVGAGPGSHQDAKHKSEDEKGNVLSSNPTHPLDAYAEAKSSKDGGRGPGI